jgi:hypothetical protein
LLPDKHRCGVRLVGRLPGLRARCTASSTSLAPGENNDDLLALDVCQNLEYFSQNLPSAEGTLVESLA